MLINSDMISLSQIICFPFAIVLLQGGDGVDLLAGIICTIPVSMNEINCVLTCQNQFWKSSFLEILEGCYCLFLRKNTGMLGRWAIFIFLILSSPS